MPVKARCNGNREYGNVMQAIWKRVGLPWSGASWFAPGAAEAGAAEAGAAEAGAADAVASPAMPATPDCTKPRRVMTGWFIATAFRPASPFDLARLPIMYTGRPVVEVTGLPACDPAAQARRVTPRARAAS